MNERKEINVDRLVQVCFDSMVPKMNEASTVRIMIKRRQPYSIPCFAVFVIFDGDSSHQVYFTPDEESASVFVDKLKDKLERFQND